MGKKEDEFSRRLRTEGIPAGQSLALLEGVQREIALEKAPQVNPTVYEDKRHQRFSDLWFSQRTTATIEQKNRVGLSFIAKVLGLGDDVAEKFATGDHRAYHAVGMKQSSIPCATNTFEFWKEVQTIFPEIYRDEDVCFLVEEGGVSAVLHFLWQIEVPLAEESPVLRDLARNAHIYK